MRILYFSPSSFGGLADYAQAQAEALAEAGADVAFLCGPDFPQAKPAHFRRLPHLIPHRSGAGGNKWMRGFRMAQNVIANHRILAHEIEANGFEHVLFGAYAEYFSPLWAGTLKRLRDVRFGAIVHDPVRETVLGPKWWHRASVAKAYSVFDAIFVHEKIDLETGGRNGIRAEIIPHGPYAFPSCGITKANARRRLGVPAKTPVLLQFGHIRDSKNLDLVLDILPRFPEVHLLVAGKEQSGSERPARFYQERAKKNGVAGRCHWFAEQIPADEVEIFFAAADLLLLPYNRDFRSASGVLNASVQFRLPCLATSGAGPLKTQVRRFNLGLWRQPDNADALADGLQRMLDRPPQPDWELYETENAWSKNAQRVIETFRSLEAKNVRETAPVGAPVAKSAEIGAVKKC